MEHWTRDQNVRFCLTFVVLLLAVRNAESSVVEFTTSIGETTVDFTTPGEVTTGGPITTDGLTTFVEDTTDVSTREMTTPINIDECATDIDNCSPQATCDDNIDGFTCTCNTGYMGDGVSCTDINECNTNNGGCSSQASCTNTAGSRTCTCDTGYSGNGLTCFDVNECLTNNGGCSTQATCTNTGGSRTCNCNSGYTGNGIMCSDINECDTNNGGCSSQASCTNTAGSRTCTCNTGYSGNGLTCFDVNECLTNNGGCSTQATCTNTGGSRTCTCNSGFTGNGVTCSDINECNTNNGGCSTQATCSNTAGSRTCTCNSGFTGDGVTCSGADCSVNNGGCATVATCSGPAGSITCTCNSGYTGNGVTCSDINECITNNGGCSFQATCTNTAGSRTCNCNSGFTGDGVTCADVNECDTNNGGCSTQATCSNTPGSRTCTCNSGFTGTGVTCSDINECTTANPCDQQCANTVGGFTCSCNAGFVLDPQDPTTCIEEGMCCPVSAVTSVNDRLLTTNSGICVYYHPNIFERFQDVQAECASRAIADGLTGGQFYTEPNAAVDPNIRDFVDDLTSIPIGIFPTTYVNFRRTSPSNPFLWGDAGPTELQANDMRWVAGAPTTPTSGDSLDCGALIDTNGEFGFTNVNCDALRSALCTVNGVTCPEQGLSARVLFPITRINGKPAAYSPTLNNSESDEARQLNKTVCSAVKRNVRGRATCSVTGTEEGSIVAYVEVNMTRTHNIRTSEQLKDILLSRQKDENGYVMLYDTDGNVLTVDPGRLEVDDREDVICKSDTCHNGGTCTFDSRFIQAKCQCQTGFQGAKCERTDDSSSVVILLVVLTLVLSLLILVSCFWCGIYLRKRKSLSEKKGVYPAEWPATISNHVPLQTLYKGVDSQLVMRNAFAQLDEEFQKRNSLPRVIRNRRVDEGSADSRSITSGSDLGDNEEDDYDVETILDNKRMAHFEQVFYRATETYPRAPSLHDASSLTSSGTSIIKPPLSDAASISGGNREFETPYPADGSINN